MIRFFQQLYILILQSFVKKEITLNFGCLHWFSQAHDIACNPNSPINLKTFNSGSDKYWLVWSLISLWCNKLVTMLAEFMNVTGFVVNYTHWTVAYELLKRMFYKKNIIIQNNCIFCHFDVFKRVNFPSSQYIFSVC